MRKIEHSYLNHLEKQFIDTDLDCVILERSEGVPFESLILYLGEDYLKRQRVLEITVQKQELGQALLESPPINDMHFLRVQFQIVLPFKVEDTALLQTGSLILFLNHLLELPGFEMNEADGKISYRHVLLSTNRLPEQQICLSIVGLIIILLDLFTETIENIATGKMTFDELLTKIIDLNNELQKKKPL